MMDSLANFILQVFAYLVVASFIAIPIGVAFIVILFSCGWLSLSDIFGDSKSLNQ